MSCQEIYTGFSLFVCLCSIIVGIVQDWAIKLFYKRLDISHPGFLNSSSCQVIT